MCLVKRAATSVDDMAAAGASCVRRITTWQYDDAQHLIMKCGGGC